MWVKSLAGKIKNNLKIIADEWRQDTKEYSISLAFTRLMGTVLRIFRLKSASAMFQNKKNDIVLSYLEQKYGHVFLKYKNEKNMELPEAEKTDELPVWVCWLDGIEKAPSLVRQCINSIYKHVNGHPVILITWENISDYIEVPRFLADKVIKKEIGYAHYSDILRVFLLEKYGGMWLDATIFCSKDLPEEYFSYNFFSCKSHQTTPGCVSDNRWTTFCLGGRKGNILFKTLKDFYLEYWKYEIHAIDYLFFDDAIELARKLIPEVKKEIDLIPLTNDKRDELIQRFADPWSEEAVADLINSDTVIFKLGYRESRFLREADVKGNSTVYTAFLKGLF